MTVESIEKEESKESKYNDKMVFKDLEFYIEEKLPSVNELQVLASKCPSKSDYYSKKLKWKDQ